MTEPDVTLTDYLLAAEAGLFFVLLQRGSVGSARLRTWFSLFFAAGFVASLCGGTVHGFFLEPGPGQSALWTITLLAMGVAALAAWAAGAAIWFSITTANRIQWAAVLQWFLYAGAVLGWTQQFWIALLETLPAMLFLMFALGAAYLRKRHWTLLAAAGGLAFTLLAGALQHLRVGIHPLYFNHNALSHVFQAVALLLLFLGANHLVRTGVPRPNRGTSAEVDPLLKNPSGGPHAHTT